MQLSSGVLEEVERPAKDLVNKQVPENDDGGVLESLSELALALGRYARIHVSSSMAVRAVGQT